MTESHDERDGRLARLVQEFGSDLRYGIRWLWHAKAFAAAGVLSLALGIGANASIFNLINVVLLQSLPVRQPERLVVYSVVNPDGPGGYGFSTHMFQAFRERSAGTFASSGLRLSVETGNELSSTVASGQMVSGNYFEVLGVPPARGRLIQAGDDGAPGTGAVAVLSYGYWQRRFGGDPSVVGSVVRLNGLPFTVVGISAREFFGTHVGSAIDVTVPMSMQPPLMSEMPDGRISGQGVGDYWLELMGRLEPGITSDQAQAQMDAIYQPIVRGMMSPRGKMRGHPRLAFEPGGRGLSDLRRRFSKPLLVLMAAVALVLLIACANVANLMLARAAARRREMAVRVSLGARRGRLVRQLMTESLLLSTLGGGLGLLFALWSSRALAGLLVEGDAYSLAARPDMQVLLFTLAVSAATGLVFGLAPAFVASRVDTNTALKDNARQVVSGGRFGTRGWLVAAQVAISFILLVGAGLFVRTLMNLRQLDLGIDQEHVLMLRLEPVGSNQKRQNEARLRQIYGAVLERVAAVPGVRAASLAGATPLSSENQFGAAVTIPGYAPEPGTDMRVDLKQVFPGYFAAAGIPLLAGRDFSDADDRPAASPVAVINERMARTFFGGPAAALGRTFKDGIKEVSIVGVVGNTRDRALRDEGMPMAYETFAKASTGRGQMTLLVRAAGDPRTLASTIRQLAHEADPAMPLLDAQTVADRVDMATRQEQVVALLSSLFGAIALALAAIGLYGILAYSVARRGPEFGVRLALGASPQALVRLVLAESSVLVGVGLAAGLLTAALLSRSIARMLFALAPVDPIVFAAAAATLLAVAVLAAWMPARAAARVDPIVTLREG